MSYVAEPVPSTLILNMFEQKWDNHSGNVPKPKIIESNTRPENTLEIPLGIKEQSVIIIRPDVVGEQETLRDLGAMYKDVKFDVLVEIHSIVNRQRLYDLKAEVRRIIHANMHNFEGYDICYYRSFSDLGQANLNYWQGIIRVQFMSNKVLLDT